LTRSLALALVAAAAIVAGCGKKKDGAGSPAAAPTVQHVDGTPRPDQVVSAWKGAGLSPEGFQPVTPAPFGAAYCEQGRVQAIDAVVCEYQNQEGLARGKSALVQQWDAEGAHTGVALQTKLTLLGVIDRGRQDPNGKTINKVIETFRKL
jgi:hypothetical protein